MRCGGPARWARRAPRLRPRRPGVRRSRGRRLPSRLLCGPGLTAPRDVVERRRPAVRRVVAPRRGPDPHGAESLWPWVHPPRLLPFPLAFTDCCLAAKALRSFNGTALQRAYPSRIDNRGQTPTTEIVIEGLERSPLRAEAEIDTHAGGVHDPAVAQVVQLLAIYLSVVIYPPKGIHCE